MTKQTLITIVYLLVALIFIPAPGMAAQCRVTYVYDGDTVLCRIDDISIKVRLIGIDAPEGYNEKRDAGQPYNKQAKRHLTDRLLNKVVYIKSYGLDTYNRILGELFIDGKNINLEMIKMGLAEVYRGEMSKDFDPDAFLSAEKEAREARRGIWGLGDRYISPKDWRQEIE